MNDCKSRYLNDPIFHCVVDHMRTVIRSATLTPSEVREAAMTACVIEEMYNPRPPFSTSDEDLEIVRQALAGKPASYAPPPSPRRDRTVATASELAGRPGTRDVQSHDAGGDGIPNP